MDSVLRTARYTLRMMRKSPGTSVVAVIALALGIGLTTLVFSIVYGALFRGLPFEDSSELVAIHRTNIERGFTDMSVTIHDFEDWQAQQRSFDALVGWYINIVSMSGAGDAPERLSAAFITPNAFETLGTAPAVGRWLTEADDQPGAAPVLMIGWQVWQDRYAGDPGVIGELIRINGRETSVVGVMPRGFGFPFTQNAWLPLGLRAIDTPRGQGQTLRVMGRIRDGLTIDQASADLTRIARILETEYPETNEGVGVRVLDYASEGIGDEAPLMLTTMFGAVLFVLLIACANVTNVLMGRAMLRSREVAVRTALGASRRRILLQFLLESFLLTLVGATIGVGIAAVGIRWFNAAIIDTGPPFWLSIRLDRAALLATFGAALVAALVAGMMPALQAAKSNANEILKDESRGSSSFRQGRASRTLVIIELALSVALLFGAGLMVKSAIRLNTLDLGFPAASIFHGRLTLPTELYPDDEARTQFADELLARLDGLQGASAVAVSAFTPAVAVGSSRFAIEDETPLDQELPWSPTIGVTPGYFNALSVRVARGRDFSDSDRAGALPVLIVNEAFESRYLSGDAIGKRVKFGSTDESPWRTVVGVVPDMIAADLDSDRQEAIYRPLAQVPSSSMSILVRTGFTPNSLARPVGEVLRSIDPDLPMYDAGALDELIAKDNWYFGVFGILFFAFGAAALFLASVGLYGVMSFSVSQRTREMGVRMAVGARSGDVLRLVLRQGMTQTAIGLAIGVALGLGLSNLLAGFLFRVEPRDPVVFLLIVAVLVGTALLACYVPARRATGVDPLTALRYE